MKLTSDGGYIIAGKTKSFGAGLYDAYLIKTKPDLGVEEKKDHRLKTTDIRLFCYPNPFTKKVELRYRIPEITKTENGNFPISQFPTSLCIYDVSGRLVRNLVTGNLSSGALMWDGRDDRGMKVKSGVYFIKLEVKGEKLKAKEFRKVIKIK